MIVWSLSISTGTGGWEWHANIKYQEVSLLYRLISRDWCAGYLEEIKYLSVQSTAALKGVREVEAPVKHYHLSVI